MGKEADSVNDEDVVKVRPSPGKISTLIVAVIVTMVCWFLYIFYGKLQGVLAFIGGFFLMIQVFSFDFDSSPQSSSSSSLEQRDELGMTAAEKIENDRLLRMERASSILQSEVQREIDRAKSELRLSEAKRARELIRRGGTTAEEKENLREAGEIISGTKGSRTRDKRETTASSVQDDLRTLRHASVAQDAALQRVESILTRFGSSRTEAASHESDAK